MSLVQITAPLELPVSLVEAKAHLRIDSDLEDTRISALIAAAVQEVENFTSRQLVSAGYRLAADCWPAGGVIRIPKPPLISVQTVKYINTAGVLTTMAPTAYDVDTYLQPGRVQPIENTSWPSHANKPNAVQVEFTAGYGAAAAVPPLLKLAILEKVKLAFDDLPDRQVELLRRAIDEICWQYRFVEVV